MNGLYATGGFLLAIGIYLTIRQIRIFISGKGDRLGWDIKGLSVGIMAVMIGLYLIVKYL
jgi:hypothetical protein